MRHEVGIEAKTPANNRIITVGYENYNFIVIFYFFFLTARSRDLNVKTRSDFKICTHKKTVKRFVGFFSRGCTPPKLQPAASETARNSSHLFIYFRFFVFDQVSMSILIRTRNGGFFLFLLCHDWNSPQLQSCDTVFSRVFFFVYTLICPVVDGRHGDTVTEVVNNSTVIIVGSQFIK